MSEDEFAKLCLAEDRALEACRIWEQNIEKSLEHVHASIEGLGRALQALKKIRDYLAQDHR